jgi:hypothetical protein
MLAGRIRVIMSKSTQNEELWLNTVPVRLRHLVPKAIEEWQAKSDEFNRWAELGWDERDELLKQLAQAEGSCGSCRNWGGLDSNSNNDWGFCLWCLGETNKNENRACAGWEIVST